MIKYCEKLRLFNLGISQQSIVQSCDVSKMTVNRVIYRAKELNISWPLEPNETDAVLVDKLFSTVHTTALDKKEAVRF